jgi:hypothetical protein
MSIDQIVKQFADYSKVPNELKITLSQRLFEAFKLRQNVLDSWTVR